MRVAVEQPEVQELPQPALDAVLQKYAPRLLALKRPGGGAPHAGLPVHDQDAPGAQVLVHPRDLHARVVRKVPPEVAQVEGFLFEVELLEELLCELVHEKRRGASEVLARERVEQPLRGRAEDEQVEDDLGPRPGPEHLHRHLRAGVPERRAVHLAYARRGDGLRRDAGKNLLRRPPRVLAHDLERLRGRKRRDAVLQSRELLHQVLVDQVRAVREVLPELHEQRAEARERLLERLGVPRPAVLRVLGHHGLAPKRQGRELARDEGAAARERERRRQRLRLDRRGVVPRLHPAKIGIELELLLALRLGGVRRHAPRRGLRDDGEAREERARLVVVVRRGGRGAAGGPGALVRLRVELDRLGLGDGARGRGDDAATREAGANGTHRRGRGGGGGDDDGANRARRAPARGGEGSSAGNASAERIDPGVPARAKGGRGGVRGGR